MTARATPLLETISLNVGFKISPGAGALFHDLNLVLNAGEMICFMGPNGIGKSSLIRTIAGLQQPLSGSLKINGNLPSEDFPKQLSVVLTDRILAGSMTSHELITFGRYPYLDWNVKLSQEDHNVIERAIAQVNVKEILQKQISELSDGQLQMVMIARALAQDTPIILLDEPTAHLDLNNRLEVMKLLRDLSHKMNKAILVATHELDLALQTADKIWLAGRNKNILQGLPEDLVLNGSFDDIFQFKGFDLKSGRVQHEVFQEKVISLKGTGHYHLWTKNALERSGFKVISSDKESDRSAKIFVSIQDEGTHPRWILENNGIRQSLNSIGELLKLI
jgi:iron complex transport system ATP-binding protein